MAKQLCLLVQPQIKNIHQVVYGSYDFGDVLPNVFERPADTISINGGPGGHDCGPTTPTAPGRPLEQGVLAPVE